MRHRTVTCRRDRGLLILEALLALAVVGLLAGLWAAGNRQQGQMAKTLRDHRVASRLLEAAALEFAAGRTPVGVEVSDAEGGWVRLRVDGDDLWVPAGEAVQP